MGPPVGHAPNRVLQAGEGKVPPSRRGPGPDVDGGALIQGFPKEHRFVGSKTAIARQIGNAVPVQLAEALGRHIAHALVSTP
ncbi:DNA cytosine methyltransferase [Georgenia sp. SUBG003]|uniref:DNA cytosine methyltransferase n=1 Tax=Georgenia sp. SUBG003 TaxID=1497974 RepID=UPI003AB2E5E3